MHSVKAVLKRRLGVLPGLAPLRLALVATLLICQSFATSESAAVLTAKPIWVMPYFALAALFALSGMSLAQSGTRHAPGTFLSLRLRRVLPAYSFIIILTTIAIGPLASNLSVRSYFSDSGAWSYLFNLVALPWLTLPGVFEFNSLPEIVNAIVWTAPLYALLILLVAFLSGKPRLLAIVASIAVLALIGLALTLQLLDTRTGVESGSTYFIFSGQGGGVLTAGILGILIFRFRERVRVSGRLALLAAGVLAVTALVGNAGWLSKPLFYTLSAIPLTYLSIYLSLLRLPMHSMSQRWRPYTIGLLLYGFPLQQMVAAFGPRGQDGLVNLLLSVPPTVLLTLFTSHVFERRVLTASQANRNRAPLGSCTRGPETNATILDDAVARKRRHDCGNAVFVLIAIGAMAMLYIALQIQPNGL